MTDAVEAARESWREETGRRRVVLVKADGGSEDFADVQYSKAAIVEDVEEASRADDGGDDAVQRHEMSARLHVAASVSPSLAWLPRA